MLIWRYLTFNLTLNSWKVITQSVKEADKITFSLHFFGNVHILFVVLFCFGFLVKITNQVRNSSNEWTPAPPIEGSILVNLGDMMEIWTNGYFLATKHRVLIPDSEIKRRTLRQSIAYFVASDDDYPISKLNSRFIPVGPGDTLSLTYGDYIEKKLNETYRY